jgi:hypothetical protein
MKSSAVRARRHRDEPAGTVERTILPRLGVLIVRASSARLSA